jgi:preprotein translocase subunit SecG
MPMVWLNFGGIPMEILTMVVTILQLLCGLVIILAVLFQSGKSAGLSGAIGGVADSFLAKNKAKTMDAKLARATKWIGAVFLILTLVLLILQGRAA